MKVFRAPTPDGNHPARDGKLIRREHAAHWLAGEQCLQRAQQDAHMMLVKAQERAIEEETRGYAEGLARARAEQQRIITETILRRDAYLGAIEAELVGVVINAVRQIFSEFDDAERIRITVAQALKTLRDQPQATVRVHPSQCGGLREATDALARTCPNLNILVVESDARIKSGTCVLTSDMGIIETDLDTQIRELEYALTRGISSSRT